MVGCRGQKEKKGHCVGNYILQVSSKDQVVKYPLTCRKLLLRCLWKNIKVQWRVPGKNKYILPYTFFVCFRERPFEIKQYEPGPSCTENETIEGVLTFRGISAQDFIITFIPIASKTRMFLLLAKKCPQVIYYSSQRPVYKGIDLKIIIKCGVAGVWRHIGFVGGSKGRELPLGTRRAEQGLASWSWANDGNSFGFFYFVLTWWGLRSSHSRDHPGAWGAHSFP